MASTMDAELDVTVELERLETGELNPAQARDLFRRVLGGAQSDSISGDVYASLRSWTGRLLRSSADADDLRAWHNLFRAVAARFRGEPGDWSTRVSVLGELIYERAGMAETRRAADVLSRLHVAGLLGEIAASEEGRLGRAELGSRLGLEQANLTRVCTLLLDAGLIGRREEGRSVSFELTSMGLAHARKADAPSARRHGATAASEDHRWRISDEIEVASTSPSISGMDQWARYDDPVAELPLAA